MSKIKLTKGELKRQRDNLRQFRHYLPTLQLKKQQLQMKILEARHELARVQARCQKREQDIQAWIGVLADPQQGEGFRIQDWVVPQEVVLDSVNIAGANVPVLDQVIFPEREYDLFTTAFWVDRGVEELQELIRLLIEAKVIQMQIHTLEHELRITTQRVNLFEKIKIPESQENIRRIRIYLGDQMANAVGIGKVAKKKIELAGSLSG